MPVIIIFKVKGKTSLYYSQTEDIGIYIKERDKTT